MDLPTAEAVYSSALPEGMRALSAEVLESSRDQARASIQHATSLLRAQAEARPRTKRDGETGGGLLAWQARRVLRHIDQHLTARLSVADLGKVLSVSPSYFSRRFRRTFNEPPHRYILRRRVAQAARILQTTDVDLSEVALQCGFSDQAHLSRRFLATMKQTPSAWRRNHRTP